MSDVLLELETGRIDPETFSHRRHVEAAWLLLARDRAPFHEAYARIRAGLVALTVRVGKPERYHETLTLGFLALVHERLGRGAPRDDFDAFCRAAPDLLDFTGVLNRLGLVLADPVARAGLVLPLPLHDRAETNAPNPAG